MIQVDIIISVILPLAIFIIMFGMGLSLRMANFAYVMKQPKTILSALSMQFMLLPLMAFLIAIGFDLSPELAVGLMIISFVPSGTTSNMFTNLAKGDVALSISLTAISSLLTSFTMPLFTLLAMKYFLGSENSIEMPLLKTIFQLLMIMIFPVILGMFILSKWQKTAYKMEPLIRIFSVIFLFLIVVAIIMQNRANILSFFIQIGMATLTLNIIALGIGYWFAKLFKLSQKQSITIGYEVGIQNGALALLITGTIIQNNTMMIPAVVYSLIMFITGFIFYFLLKQNND